MASLSNFFAMIESPGAAGGRRLEVECFQGTRGVALLRGRGGAGAGLLGAGILDAAPLPAPAAAGVDGAGACARAAGATAAADAAEGRAARTAARAGRGDQLVEHAGVDELERRPVGHRLRLILVQQHVTDAVDDR